MNFLKENGPSVSSFRKVFVTQVVYLVYTVLNWYFLYDTLLTGPQDQGWIVTAIWSSICAIILIYTMVRSCQGYYSKHVNLSLFGFVVANFVQYGVGLYYRHKNINLVEDGYSRKGCVNLEADMSAYISYLTTLPMMVLTNLFYPYPKGSNRYLAIINSLNMFDFLDMAELMFSDIGCYQNYNGVWIGIFFLSTGVSAFLMTCNYGLEQQKEKKTRKDCLATCATMIFNDGLFCVLRIMVMVKEGHVYFGLIFVIKEFFSFLMRLALLVMFKYRNEDF